MTCVDELRLLVLKDPAQVEVLTQQYKQIRAPKGPVQMFVAELTSPTSWFVEADHGLIYLTNVQPGLSGTLNILWWDNKFSPERREQVRSVMATAFGLFDLIRLNCSAPKDNVPFRKLLLKLGFSLEGVMRKGILLDDRPTDIHMFGLLREELGPPPLLMRI